MHGGERHVLGCQCGAGQDGNGDGGQPGRTTATLHCSLTGQMSGDDVGCTATGVFPSAAANTYTMTASISLTGTKAGNYQLSTTTASPTATITPRPIMETANNVTIYWGQTPTFGYTITSGSVVGSDSLGSVYTGSPIFWTANSTSSTSTMTLSAVIQDIGHTTTAGQVCHGDIRGANPTFAFRNAGGTYTPISNQTTNLKVGLVDPTDTTTGIVSAIVQYNLGNSSYASFELAVIAGGSYKYSDPSEDQPITVRCPERPTACLALATWT